MPALARLRALWRAVFRRADAERELDDELRAYVELLADEHVRAGMPPDAARRAALMETGGVEQVKEAVRDARPGHRAETVLRDVRYAARTLRRAPAFTLVVLLALGLGVGATTAIFSVVDAVLLRPLPYEDPGRIVSILHGGFGGAAPANYLDWKAEARTVRDMGAAQVATPTITGGGAPERLTGLRTTARVLPMTGVRPAIGRTFGAETEQPGRDREVVLAWGLWQRRFAADPEVVGRAVVLDGVPHVVVGVMPAGFDFPQFWTTGVQVYLPLALGERAAWRDAQMLRVFGRLAPGATLDAARAELRAITARLEKLYPGTNLGVTVDPLEERVVGGVRRTLLVLLAAVGLVLLVACANVAHMLLARGAARRRELTVRAALGASRGRLVGHLLAESVLLALMGGAVGVALAAGGVRLLAWLGAGTVPRLEGVAVDGRVLAFAAAVSLATGVLFGLAPALRTSRGDLAGAMRGGDRASTGGLRESRARALLVASEFALALVLLAGAGLAIRSFARLRAVDPGLDPRGVIAMEVAVHGTAHAAPGARAAFWDELLARVRRAPGVASASLVNHLPLAGDEWQFPFAVEGRPIPKPTEWPTTVYRVAFPGYLRAMGVGLARGRDIADTDREGAPEVVLVNETFARRHWPGAEALGKRIAFGDPAEGRRWHTVVGITRDAVRSSWAADPDEEAYVPWRQESSYAAGDGGHVGYMTLVVRAACAPDGPCDGARLAPALREAVWSIDRGIPASPRTMDEVVAGANARPRFTLFLLASFAGVALALAAVGIYGVMSYAVSQRTREIGVRLALGAAPGTVLRLVVRQGMAVALAGILAGVLGALLLTRLMAGMLYGVEPTDPATFATVPLVLGLVALAATLAPAVRATRIDPLLALRGE